MFIAGVDEAGRGPLAGPVIAAAVILDPKRRYPGVKDSKLLTAQKRETLFTMICTKALAWGIGRAEVEEIDSLNILQATFLAMQRAINALSIRPTQVWVDGNKGPNIDIPMKYIIDGDKYEKAISAASILAKVARDREMLILDQAFPGYGFAQHKGYGTELHMKALKSLGPCRIHRQSFSPVKVLSDRYLERLAI